MLKTVRRLALAILAAALALSAANPTLGTWKLNKAKSKYSPGPAPKSSTLVYSQYGDWIVQKSEGVNAEGKPTTLSNRYKVDGKEYPFTGPAGSSGTIAVKKIDDYLSEWVIKGEDKSLVNGRTVISKDGKTRTQTMTGVNAKGETVKNVVVYDRQ